MRRIVCAAIRAADGELLIGVRHYDALMCRQIEQRVDGAKFAHRLDEDQGFIDQRGEWLSRHEAYLLAHENGQLLYINNVGADPDGKHRLYSEALY